VHSDPGFFSRSEEISMTQSRSCTAIVGVGPGLGAALAERFAREGHAVAVLARSAGARESVVQDILAGGGKARGFDCDAGKPESVAAAFAQVRATFGDPEVLVYNAGLFAVGGLLELAFADFEEAWRVNCFGGFLAAREVVPAMLKRGRGTLLFTGATAALRGGAPFAGLAVGKFGLRALAQSLAREFGPEGIHVAHIVIDGQIGLQAARQRDPERSVDSFLAPEAIADAYWQLHAQPRSAWTLEQDLRPFGEHF
jgi:NAD(P)-dependent dehydrogenase (short-subunit alcohol dehydrogenase family)